MRVIFGTHVLLGALGCQSSAAWAAHASFLRPASATRCFEQLCVFLRVTVWVPMQLHKPSKLRLGDSLKLL